METATQAIGFAPSALWTTAGTLISLGVIALLVMNLIAKYRELRKPKVTNEKTVEQKLANDNERLNRLEATAREQDTELKLILRSQVAMLHHMIDGNGVQRLKETQRDIEDYLVTGKVRHEA